MGQLSRKTTEAVVVARNVKRNLCWLRVADKYGWKILTLPDDVIPYGMKTAERLRVTITGEIRHEEIGYTADIEVNEDISAEADY